MHRSVTTLAGALLVAVVLLAGACGDDDDDGEGAAGDGGDDTTETTSPEAESATVFALREGDCLASDPTAEATQVSEVPSVDCDEPHHSEVFHTAQIDSDDFPTAAEMEGIVQEECIAEFESFVGKAYADSALEVTWLEPTQESWDAGDRELVCMIVDPAGQTTGSLEGANR